MDKKDITSSNLINSKEQLLEEYGNLFSQEVVDGDDFYLEIPSEDKLDIHRFIITPSGFTAITATQRDEVWGIGTETEEDREMLRELDQVINQALMEMENLDIPTLLVKDNISRELTEEEMSKYIADKRTKALIREISIDSLTLYLRIFPYGEARASEVARFLLNERK